VINRLDPVRQQAFLYVVAFLRFLIDRKSSQLPEESGARQQETEGLRGKFAILFGTCQVPRCPGAPVPPWACTASQPVAAMGTV